MTAILSYALTSLADVKESLGISSGDTSKDNLLIRLINKGTELIESYCGRRFKGATFTSEKWDGDGSDYSVRNFPITSVTNIQYLISDPNTDEWDTLDTSLYNFDPETGIVHYEFSTGFQNWRITYVGGYTTIPSDLAEACVDFVTYMYNHANSSGVKSERLGDRSVEWFATTNSSAIKELGIDDILDAYRVPRL